MSPLEARDRLRTLVVSEVAQPGASQTVEDFEGIPCELSPLETIAVVRVVCVE